MVNTLPTTIWLQSFAVTGTPTDQTYPQNQMRDALGNTFMSLVQSANVSDGARTVALPYPRDQLLKATFTSTALILHSELNYEYAELGNALREMTLLGEGDEWKLDTAAYQAACQVASELWARSFPAPQVFSHGATSVVFNWSAGRNNLYLTISSDYISALSSTLDRIQRRVEFSRKELPDPRIVTQWLLAAPSEHSAISERNAASQLDATVG